MALVGAACAPRRKRTFETTIDVSALASDGAILVATAKGIDDYPILVVRAKGEFRAYSSQCSHMGCPVNAPQQGVITCPCHGSQYDLGGKVLKGPAEYPLARYETELASGGRLVVFVTE